MRLGGWAIVVGIFCHPTCTFPRRFSNPWEPLEMESSSGSDDVRMAGIAGNGIQEFAPVTLKSFFKAVTAAWLAIAAAKYAPD